MVKIDLCPCCGRISRHFMIHETQYTATIIRRFWRCGNCNNQSFIQEIDTLK